MDIILEVEGIEEGGHFYMRREVLGTAEVDEKTVAETIALVEDGLWQIRASSLAVRI